MTTVKALVCNPTLVQFSLPVYSTQGSAGIDLRACIENPVTISEGETCVIRSGIAIEIPTTDLAAVLLPRSGLGVNHGIVLSNLVGLIDSDYHQEIMIAVWNRSATPYTIFPGDRICQLVFIPIVRVDMTWQARLSENGRGNFGSTGI